MISSCNRTKQYEEAENNSKQEAKHTSKISNKSNKFHDWFGWECVPQINSTQTAEENGLELCQMFASIGELSWAYL